MIKSLLLAVAIIAHEPGYYTSLAKHIRRWLASENISARVETPATMAAALAKERLAFLVGFASPSAAEMKTLRAFRSRGGKLVVFHSASPALAELMGVKPLGYKAAAYPGQWSRMDFSASMPEGLPKSVLQTSSVLQRAVPVKGKGGVIAVWADRHGRPTGDAAWIATAGGFWMTHVLLADGDEDLKARLLGAIAGSVVPGSWNLAAHSARKAAERRRTKALAEKQVPCRGEIHAVWDHSGCGLYPGNWPKTIRILKESRVTDLFVNVAGAGFAHYPSSVLARSKTFQTEGDQLAKCLAAAKDSGIRVHAWMLCFTASRAAAGELERFRKLGWRLRTADGKLSEYLNPGNPAVAAHVLSAIDEIQSRYGVAGIHLDFVRWYERSVRPANAADAVTRFVSAARRRVKRPKWLTAAVLGKYPQCVASVGQDWTSWLDTRLVDYVVPMDYTESSAVFESYLRQHAGSKSRARRTIAGIGVTANESRLDAAKVISQINLARKYGLAGVSLFDLDTMLEKNVLPYLVMGIW
jgi:uncharacterized lipoprotein YddW (UPF0748 family)